MIYTFYSSYIICCVLFLCYFFFPFLSHSCLHLYIYTEIKTMMRCQLLSPRVCITANVRQIITSACMEKSKVKIHRNVIEFSDSSSTKRYHDGNRIVSEVEPAPHHTYIDTSKFQRIILSIGSSIAALVNPHRLL